MKKVLILMIISLTYFCLAFAEIGILWSHTSGGTHSDVANSFCIDSEENLVAAGYTNSFGSGQSDMFFTKTNSEGNEIWNQTFGNSGWESAKSICNAIDGNGYVAAGYTTSAISNTFDISVIKIDDAGDIVWEKTFGGDGFDTAESICQTSDGYFVCGYTNSYGLGEDDIYLIKLDINGDSLFTKTIGCEKSDMGHSIKPISDGNYIISGSTGLYDIPIPGSDGRNREVYLIKIDEDGTILAENTYWIMDTHQNSFDTGYDICEAIDGSFYIVGCTSQHFQELMDVCLLKVDSDLNEIWKTNLEIDGFYDFGYSICEIEQTGNIAICGSYKSVQDLKANMFCMLLDYNGIEIEQEYFGNSGSECGNKIMQTADGSLIIAGYTSSEGAGGNDLLLLKLDIGQTNNINELVPLPEGSLYNYPNPFNPTTTISFSVAQSSSIVNLEIFNLKGQKVKTLDCNNSLDAALKQLTQSIIWNGDDDAGNQVGSGIYFYRLSENGESKAVNRCLLLK